MHIPLKNWPSAIALALLILAGASAARAATFTWDASGTSAGTPADGAGTWSTTGTNWSNGASDAAWNNGNQTDIAVFGNGGTPGTVTVSGGVNVGGITFNPVASGTYYTIGGSTITLTGSGLITTRASSAAINSVLAGGVGLTTSGTGTLILTGANTYSGGTTIGSGVLQIGNGSSNGTMGTGAYNIASGAKLYLDQGASPVTPSWANVSGAGTFELNDALASGSVDYATLALSSSFTGTLVIDGHGRVNGGPGNLGGTTAVVINNGGQFLAFTGTAANYTYTQAFSINGLGSEASLNFGAIRISSENATFSGPITLTGSSGLYNQFGANESLTISGVISDGGSGYGLLIDDASNNAGGITFTNANTYTGVTTVIQGVLTLSSTSGVAIAGNIAFGNGSSSVNPYIITTQANQFSNGTVISFLNSPGGYTRLELDGNNQTLAGLSDSLGGGVIENGGVNLAAPVSGTLTLDPAAGSSYSYLGYMRNLDNTGSNTLSLVISGSGRQTLGGANITYTGPTTINSGTLALQDTTAFASGTTTVSAGGALVLNRTANGFANRGTLAALITGAGTINVSSSTSGINGGWVRLSDASHGLSNFTGTVNVNSGVLSLDDLTGAWSGNPELNVVSGGLLAVRGQAISVDALTGNGDVFNSNTNLATLTVGAAGGSGTFSGVIHGNNTGTGDGTLEQGILNLAKSGTGTETLTGANTYTGSTLINSGTLQIGNGSTGSIANGSAITVSSTGTLVFEEVTSSTQSNTIANSGMVVGAEGAGIVNTLSGAISGTGGFKQNGAGETILSSASTNFSGPTTVTSGSLELLNASGFVSTATVNPGATLVLASTFGNSTSNRFSGLITGSGALNIISPSSGINGGWVEFLAANAGLSNFTGTVNVLSGVLAMNDTVGAWSGNPELNVVSGGLYALYAQNIPVDALTGNGDVFNGYINSVTLTVGAANGSGTFSGVIHGNNTGTAVGQIEEGLLGLTKSGTGTEILTGSNTYTGTTTVNGGTLQIGNGSTGSIASGITTNGGGAIAFDEANGSTIGNTISDSGTMAGVEGAGIVNTLNGTISGAGVFVQSGSGETILSGANIGFTGGATVNSGTLGWDWTARATTTAINNVGMTVNPGGVLVLTNTNTSGTVLFQTATLSGGGIVNQTGGGDFDFWSNGSSSNLSGFSGTYNIVSGELSIQTDTAAHATMTGALFNVAAGSFLDLRTQSVSIDRLTGAGNVGSSFSSETLTVGNANGSSTFYGVIANQGIPGGSGNGQILGLTKSGTGTFTLEGANSYSNATTINGGTLELGGPATDPSSAITISGTAALQIDSTGKTLSALTVSNTAATLILASSTNATTTVSGAFTETNNYTVDPVFAGLPVTGGTYNLLTPGSVSGAGVPTLNLGLYGTTRVAGTLAIVGGKLQLVLTSGAANLVWNNASTNGTWDFNTSQNFNNGGGNSTFETFDAVTFNDTAPGGTITLSGNLVPSAVTVSTTGSYTFAGSGSIGGDAILTKSGTGTLTILNSNNYGGVTTINAGTLQLGNGTTANGSIANSSISNSGTFAVNNPLAQIYSGIISGAGTVNISGTGVQTWTGQNNNTGVTNVNAGELSLTNMLSWASGTTTVASGARLDINIGTGTQEPSAAVSPIFTGSGLITKTGLGIWYPTSGSYAANIRLLAGGELDIQAGTVEVGFAHNFMGANLGSMNVGSLGGYYNSDPAVGVDALTGSGIIGNAYSANVLTLTIGVSNDVTNAAYGVTNNTATWSGNITANNGFNGVTDAAVAVVKTGTGTQIFNGTNTYTGSTTINQGILQLGNGGSTGSIANTTGVSGSSGAELAFDLGTSSTFSTVISGGITVAQTGTGTLYLTGANSYTGGTLLNAGTLNFNSSAALGATNSGITFTGNGTLQSGTSGITLTNGQGVALNNGVTGTIDTNGNNTAINGTISGQGALTKIGAGKLTLAGGSTYTGATTVSNGTLYVSGSLGNTAVTVSNGANFGGTGTVTGAVTVSGGGLLNLVDGSIGTLTLDGGLTIGSNSTPSILDFEALSTSLDLVNDSTGLLNVTGSATINITNLGGLAAGTYNLITFNSTAGNLNLLTLGTPNIAGKSLSLLTTSTSEELVVVGPSVYWTGSNSNVWSTTNWAGNAAETSGTTAPNSGVDVYFNANGVAGPVTASLGANFDINSLNFNSNATGLTTISDGTFGLTIEAGGIAMIPGSGAATVNVASITVNTSQTWINSSANALTIGSPVNGAAASGTTTLTISGTGASGVFLGGPITDGTLGGKLALIANSTGGATVLDGNNTFSGGLTISSGTVQVGNNDAAGTLGNGAVIDNSVLAFNRSDNPTMSNRIADNGVVTQAGSGSLTLGGTISGAGVINQAGSGSLVLSGSNSFSGTVNVTAGYLDINNGYALGSGTLALNGGGIDNTTGSALTLSANNKQLWSGNFSFGGSNPLNLGTGAITLTATPVINVAGSTLTVGSVIAGSGFGITKTGTGTLDLTAVNTNTGTTAINGGTLELDVSGLGGNLSMPSPYVVGSTGTLTINSNSSFSVESEYSTNISLSGSGTFNKTGNGDFEFFTGGSSIKNFAGQINVMNGIFGTNGSDWGSSAGLMNLNIASGAYFDMRTGNAIINQLSGSGTAGSTWQTADTLSVGNNNGSSTFAGSIINNFSGIIPSSNSGSIVSLTKNGTGTLILTGSNTYSGTTTINGGTLQIGNGGSASSIGSGSITGLAGGTLAYDVSTSGTLNRSIGGGINFTQAGSGILTLAGSALGYSGTTTVTNGTLIVAGSISGNAIITGGTFGTTGGTSDTIGQNVTVGNGLGAAASSVLDPSLGGGASTTILNVNGNVSLNSDAAFVFALNSGEFGISDGLAVSGTLTLAGALQGQDIGNTALAPGADQIIIASYGTLNGTFAGLPEGGLINIGQNWFSVDYGNINPDEITLTSAAIPEPGTWGTVLAGFALLIGLQRRRRSKLL